MRYVISLLGLLLCCSSLQAAAVGLQNPQVKTAQSQAGKLVQTTEKGAFRLELSLGGSRLGLGPNSLDMTLRDKNGQVVEGAEVVVTPWMPTMGHGVWDKPLVTERGAGKYHVENVKIIMAGRWDLRVSVRKGSLEGRALFPFDVSEAGGESPPLGSGKHEDSYERSLARYSVPNVTLLNQDGEAVRLRTITDSGKPLIMDFIFTTCTTICPVLSAGLANLRSELGENATGVQIVSITIDPEYDRPQRLKEYGARFNAGPGWTFLTGNREDIGRVLQTFDAFIVDKMSHEPLYILRGPNSDQWVRIKGLVGVGDLMKEFRGIENK